jgi:putative Holliday junction resolvase
LSRVLAVDWGERRFGVALSDPGRLIAQPLATLVRRAGKRAPVLAVVDLIVKHEVDEVVVGLPLTPEGAEGEAAAAARRFGEAVSRRSGVPVHFRDERLSTAAALGAARRSGVKARDARSRLDQMAAVVILQGYLDAQRTAGTSTPAHGRMAAPAHRRTDER